MRYKFPSTIIYITNKGSFIGKYVERPDGNYDRYNEDGTLDGTNDRVTVFLDWDIFNKEYLDTDFGKCVLEAYKQEHWDDQIKDICNEG